MAIEEGEQQQQPDALTVPELRRLILRRWCTLREALYACELNPAGVVRIADLQRLFLAAAEAEAPAASEPAGSRAEDADRAGGASSAPSASGKGTAEATEFTARLEHGVALLYALLRMKYKDLPFPVEDCDEPQADDDKSAADDGIATTDDAGVPCRALVFELGSCAARDGFMSWASTALVYGGWEAFNDLAAEYSDCSQSCAFSCSASVASTSRGPRYRVTRDDFREMVAMLNGNSDDAGSWYDRILEIERSAVGDDGDALDVHILHRQALANPRFEAEAPMDLQQVVIRLIAVWGELTSAFGLTPNTVREEPRPYMRNQYPQMTPAISVAGRRGWRPTKGHWSRALCGKRGRYLMVERDTRLETERLSAVASEASDNIFSNVCDRLLVVKTEWKPSEVIAVRYSFVEAGFWGACGPPPLVAAGASRRIPVSVVGQRPIIAAVPADERNWEAEMPLVPLLCGAATVLDPQVPTGSAVLHVPEPLADSSEEGVLLNEWHLRIFSSDDGIHPTGILSQPLLITVVRSPPAPPTALAAEVRGADSASLTWTESHDDMGSNVLWFQVAVWELDDARHPDDELGPAVWSDRSSRRAIVAGPLRPRTRYIARVRCANRAGLGPWSEASAPFETFPAVPGRMPPPEAVPVGPSEVQVSWAHPGDAGVELRWPTKFAVQVHAMFQLGGGSQGSGAVPEPVVHTFDASETHAIISGLAANTQYCFEVHAHNISGAGPWSAPSDCVFTHAGPPMAPAPPVAIEVALDGLKVRWQHPVNNGGSSITGYCLKVAPAETTDNGAEATSLEVFHETSPAWIPGLRGNCWYSVSVAASNAFGLGAYSAPAALRTLCFPPEPPVELRAETTNADAVTIAWDPPPFDGGGTVSSYVLRALSSATKQPIEVEAVGGVTSMVLPPLYGAVEYYVTLKAKNAAGTSAESTVLGFTTDPGAPAAPSAPPRLCDDGSTKTALAIRWDPPQINGGYPIMGYELQVVSADIASGQPPQRPEGLQPRAVSADASCMVVVDKLCPGEAYSFAVRAMNEKGWSKLSRWSQPIRTAPPPPGPPPRPRPMDSTARSILVEWDPPESEGPVLEYEVACSNSAGGGTEAGGRRVRTKRTESRITGLAQSSSYVFRVRARNFSGWSQWSPPSEAFGTTGAATVDEIREVVLRRFGGTVSSAFRALDRNVDGFISKEEFLAAFDESTPGSVLEQWLRLFVAADIAGRGRLGYKEFAQCFSQYKATPALTRHHLPDLSEGSRQQLLEETYNGRRSSSTHHDPRVAEVVERLTSPSPRVLLRARSDQRLDRDGHLTRMSSGISVKFFVRSRSAEDVGETSTSMVSERSSDCAEDVVHVRTALSPSPRLSIGSFLPSPARGASSPSRQGSGPLSPKRQSGSAMTPIRQGSAPSPSRQGSSPTRSNSFLMAMPSSPGSAARIPGPGGGGGSGFVPVRRTVASPVRTVSAQVSSPRVGSRAFIATVGKAAGPATSSASTKVLEALRHQRRYVAAGPGVTVRAPPSGVVAGVAVRTVVVKKGGDGQAAMVTLDSRGSDGATCH
mmetsp:Transcript_30344/g.87524  ORF Transcript_30344/g.87524 Transcript_30344/m.87524 type:complete len:1545 (+) Transcript_30344:88-4722(+)